MSYLGGSIAYLWGQLNTWKTRANNAWGASRVWNSGASFETNYNTEFANARDSAGSVNGHATPGWGSGQLWSTTASQWETEAWDSGANADSHAGASQEWKTTAAAWHTDYTNEVTAYNNALAPVSVDEIVGTTINTGMNGGGSGLTNANELMRITIDRTGLWAFAGYIQAGNSGDGTTVWLTIYSAGTTLGSNSFGFGASHGVNSAGSGVFASPVLLTSGAVVSLYGVKDGSQNVPVLTQQGLRGWFIPTQAHPH